MSDFLNLLKRATLIAGLITIAGSSLGAEEKAVADGTIDTPPAPQKQRGGLRFKSGPVCMCNGGLSEADIRRAERERDREPGASADELKTKIDHEEE